MKKLFIFSLLVLLLSSSNKAFADYHTYQEITVKNQGMKMLENYSQADYKDYYSRLGKKKFWGWRTFTAFSNEEVYFIKDTLYVIVNEGTSPITEKITFSRDSVITKQYGVSGSIGIKGSGTAKKFKWGLESKIEGDFSYTEKTTLEEEYQLTIEVDPMTKLTIQILGEGKVTNGVAKYYRFWMESKKGGFEIFIVTTEYYSLVKEKIT